MGSSRRRLRTVLAATLAAVTLAAPVTAEAGGTWKHWTGTWAASMMAPSPGFGPNWSEEGFADHTVRQVVRVSTGGALARVRLSNAYGTGPLTITGATIGRAADGAAVRPGTLRNLTFRGSRSVVVPPGDEVASDPAVFGVRPLDSLAVTLYLAAPTGPATQHLFASATSFRADGDHRADLGAGAFTETTESWYYLAGIDVTGAVPRRDAIAAFGDSITDGALSTVDANNRYPDELAELLVAQGKPRGVLNAGIGGNRVLTDSPCLGEKATSRFHEDVLDEPRVGTVLVLEGINDIGFGALPPGEDPCFSGGPEVTAAQLIAGHRDLIRQAHRHGIRAIGLTLLPYKGAGYYTPEGEAVRDALNRWIRTSGEYDAVVDLDRIMAAPGDADLLNPAYDSGDNLHPNDAGYRAMAEAVASALR
ncbi:SGNH/GDSL hydrolase family protein [Prauserella muralis]|uniref:G-D-S-L family lipolytic protein n=1 Tax=Prauserella muralis TaxID=588067 RepID=A0A2V4ATD4_9PSEU|nr:SGNH/GDSL hydrolase family protein [Prauserella muralis]PXY22801.1 G-D-S-L family lipolytic protein [Prauserella muralis]TWE28549.1 lysophospholipase L1-like esterase [Prauserella muralis]